VMGQCLHGIKTITSMESPHKDSKPDVYVCVCVCLLLTHISVMVSGRLVGISVSPFPRQSTILLLQVHSSGHCRTLQDECDWGPKKHIKRDDSDVEV